MFDSHYRGVCYFLILFIFSLVPLHGHAEKSESTNRMSVAVVEFDAKGDLGIKDAGAIIAEWMINAVARTGRFNLKERVLLKKVLDEQNIGMTGLIKGDTASRIGEIYGVKGLITGSVFKWGNVISVTARLIDTNSGSILKTAGLKATDINSIPGRIDELALIIVGKPSEKKEKIKEAGAEKKKTTGEEIAKREDNITVATDDMVHVKGGCFKMTCSNWAVFCDPDYDDNVSKQKTCVEDFYIDKYETTQKAYKAATGENPSYFKGEKNPVERVTWPDAKKYCEQRGMRLPSEAEWAYAASEGGVNFSWEGIESRSTLKKYAWYNKDSKHKSRETGRSGPDSLGIYDLQSNVWEWVGKWQDPRFMNKFQYSLGQGRYLFDLREMDLPRSCDPSRRFSRRCNTEPYRRSLVIGFRCVK